MTLSYISLSPATLGCQQALLRGKLAGRVTDAECQAGGGLEEEEEEEAGLSALTKNQLQLEVQSLSRERDSLTTQLQESTMEFQQQLKLLQEKCEEQHLGSSAEKDFFFSPMEVLHIGSIPEALTFHMLDHNNENTIACLLWSQINLIKP